MALATRSTTFKQAAATACRPRCVKVMAVHQPNKAASLAACAAAAVLLVSSPAFASPLLLNPVSDLAIDPVGKVLNKLDSMDPPKGVKGPEVEGEFRSNPDKARALAAENSPAGSPEAEAKGGACPCTGQMDCPC